MKKYLPISILLIAALLFTLSSCVPTGDTENPMSTWITVAVMIVLCVFMFVFMGRGNKKKERETEKMRNELSEGDEITTIGGIVGRVVSVSELTIVIETTRDKTRLRIMKWAIKSIDVKVSDSISEVIESAEEKGMENDGDKGTKKEKKKKMKD